MTLYARLDKAGERVLCGLRDCGTELARIVTDEPGVGAGRFVAFGPGWRPRGTPPPGIRWEPYGRDGVWELNARGRRRRRYQGLELTPAQRRARQTGDRRGRPPRPQDDVVSWGLAPWNLPVRAACPACGSVQTIDPDVLRVDPHRSSPSVRVGIPGETPPEQYETIGPRVPGASYRLTGPSTLGAAVEWPPGSRGG